MTPHLSYLILNELTLFYSDLSAPKTSRTEKVQNWTAQVAKANKKSKVVPDAGTATATTTTAVHTNRTTTSSSAVVVHAGLTTKKKAKLEPEAGNSAFLDEDESAERDAALTSPIKGKKRLTTKVQSPLY
jgi:hypothetical protein